MSNDIFSVDVPGIGTFTFWRRNEHHIHMIDAEKRRLLSRYAPHEELNAWATMIAVITVLTIKAPDGFRIEGDDQVVAGKVLAVYSALRDAEDLLNNHYHFTPNPVLSALWN